MAKQRFGINDAYRGTVGTVIGYEWRGKWCLRARPLHVHNPRTAKQQGNRLLFKQMVDLASRMKTALRKGLRGVSLGMHITECNLFVKRNKECFELDGAGRMVVEWENLIISEGSVVAPVFEVPEMMAHPALQAPLPTGGEENRDCRSLPTGGVPQRGGVGREKDRGSSSTETHAPVRCASTPSNLEGELVSSDCGSGSSPKLGEVDARRADGGVCMSISFTPHAEGERASGDDEVYVWAYCPEAGEGVLSASSYRRSKQVSLTLPERWQGKEVHLYGFAVDYEGEASPTVYIGCLEVEPVETHYAVSQNNTFDNEGVGQNALLESEDSVFSPQKLAVKKKILLYKKKVVFLQHDY